MKAVLQLALALTIFVTLVAAALTSSQQKHRMPSVMPWMCLERCKYNASTIRAHVAAMAAHPKAINRVSVEWSDLGPNGTVIDNNFTNVDAEITAFAKNYGMVTTVNLGWIRQVIHDQALGDSFIRELTKRALARNMSGVNFDWEPTEPATAADAQAYAAFFKRARATAFEVSQSQDFTLSVDVATWNTLWDWKVINAAMTAPLPSGAPIGEVMPMSTYTYDNGLFLDRLHESQQNISAWSLTTGLMSWNGQPDKMTAADVEWRFGALAYAGICNIAIWVAPLPDFWYPILETFMKRCGPHVSS